MSDVIALPNGRFVVMWHVTNPDTPNDRRRKIRVITTDGPVGDEAAIFEPPTVTGPGSFAIGHDRVLALATDETRGCQTRTLDLNGAIRTEARSIGLRACLAPRVTTTGFAVHGHSDLASGVHRYGLTADGALRDGATPIPILDGVNWWSRSVASDGSELVFAITPSPPGSWTARELTIDRRDETGRAIAGPSTVAVGETAWRVRSTALATGDAAVVWLEREPSVAGDQWTRMHFARVNANAEMIFRAPTSLAGVFRDGGVSIAALDTSKVVVVYVGIEPTDPHGVRATLAASIIDLEGHELERVVLREGVASRNPLARVTRDGVLVAYNAPGDTFATQVHITGIACAN